MALFDFSKIFGKKEQVKEKGLADDLMFYRPGATGNVTINKNTLYTIYRQNPDVRSCVRIIAQYVGSKYFSLYNEKGKVEEEKEYKQYDRVRTLMKNKTFLETIIEMLKHAIVCGELYLLPTTGVDKKVNGFQIIHPKTITKWVKDGKIVRFSQQSAGSYKEYFPYNPLDKREPQDTLLYFQLEKHTNNEMDGMGLLEGIFWDVLSDMKAQERNYVFFENDMTPPSVILVDDTMSKDGKDLLKDQLEEKHKGTWNAHKPFLGVGVKDWKSIAVSPKDMEHVAQRKITTDKVCAALLVPKSRLGYVEDVNRATSMADEKNFVEGTVNSYQLFIEYVVNEFIKAFWTDFNYEFVFERQTVVDEVEVKKMRLEELKRGGLTLNEYRVFYGMEAYKEEEANKPLIAKDVILLEDVTLDPIIDTNNQ